MIEIREFKGILTNADIEDIPVEYCSELKDFKPYNGRLVRKGGIATLISTAHSADTQQMFTFISDKLAANTGSDNTDTYKIIRVDVNSSTKALTVYRYNHDTSAWVDESVGTFYHNSGLNPVVISGNIYRILPGVTAEPDGSHNGYGLWYGHIDRKFFDELYTPTAQFYSYNSLIPNPSLKNTIDFNVGISQVAGSSDFAANDIYYYRFTAIYDGVQESLMSTARRVEIGSAGNLVNMKIIFATSYFSKRITGVNIYRSEKEYSGFGQIASISTTGKSGANIYLSESFLPGYTIAYIPGLEDYDFDSETEYGIDIDSIKYWIKGFIRGVTNYQDLSGTGWCLFALCTASPGSTFQADANISGYYTTGTNLYSWSGSWSTSLSYTTDIICGDKALIIYSSNTYDAEEFIGAYAAIPKEDSSTRSLYSIADITVSADSNPGDSNYVTVLESTSAFTEINAILDDITIIKDGYFWNKYSSTSYDCYYLDNSFSLGSAHPLDGEVSIDVIGKYAIMVNKRLFQGNIALDPYEKNELHVDWVSYSELNQPDVNPVSNVIPVPDREGGEITGLAELFGRLVILKKQGVFLLNMAEPSDPLTWTFSESMHNIGHISEYPPVSINGQLYIVHSTGIYALSVNDMAESALTPTKSLRITEVIQDVFDAISDKTTIQLAYDQENDELLVIYGTASSVCYTYNVLLNAWRKFTDLVYIQNTFRDQNGDLLLQYYSGSAYSVQRINSGATTPYVTTNWIRLDDEYKVPVNYIRVRYKSNVAMTMYVYLDGSGTATKTQTISASATLITAIYPIRVWAKQIQVKILCDSSSGSVEIHKITIE